MLKFTIFYRIAHVCLTLLRHMPWFVPYSCALNGLCALSVPCELCLILSLWFKGLVMDVEISLVGFGDSLGSCNLVEPAAPCFPFCSVGFEYLLCA